MAVAIMFEFSGATLDQYDRVVERMNLGGKTAPGGIFHVCGPTENGIRIVDVWESQEVFEKFSKEQIEPITREFGMHGPKVTIWPVHNILTPTPSGS